MNDASYSALAKFFVPKIPGMIKAAAAHSLSLSDTSSKWDLQTTLTVSVLRQLMSNPTPAPLGKTQALTLKDPGPKGKLWTAPATIPAPRDDGTKEAIFKAIADMGDGNESYTKPENVDVRVEWTGFRSDAKSADEPHPTGLTPQERYNKLMADPTRTSKVTFLYFHGGAYYMCGFPSHRIAVSRLAKGCNGRALAVEYRLAPQAAFPSQLIDAFNAYLYLLYPPEGSLHEPVPASEIVFGGDSAGGNLSFALLQLLLQLHRTNKVPGQDPKVSYNGREVAVPLPAGVTGLSAWLDISRSSPSLFSNAKWDYLPPPKPNDAKVPFPKDDIWPTNPPRGDTFCDLSLLSHPLASQITANDWTGSPPLWMMTGDEMLYDENAVVAVKAREQGVTVQWEHYEAMPHVFSMLIPHLGTSNSCYTNWGQFGKDCVDKKAQPKNILVRSKTGKEEQVELRLGKESPFSWEEAVKNVEETKRRRIEGYEKEAKALPKPSL
ncbi:hypothetical protein K461DRAFT_283317 [Myriangium duriaei CBS 260.36]|uniref:Alpha/beta hydrolase fold-3 domain-containing protein n=1 Tax=Myriangium duriaei CBS 260.36 TaxID=1168546 RepID=A0A9P4IVX5_9PEZI|nr:hypothetical protein K461DRAFT_283317 [Myriangium duriaei CBS 260.36]